MLNAPTLDKLQALKLAAMAAAWTEQQHQADLTALAFDERFGLLVGPGGRDGRHGRPNPVFTVRRRRRSPARA